MMDKHIREILEHERESIRSSLDRVAAASAQKRAELANMERHAAEMTETLDAIEAELGAYAEATA